MGRYKFIEGTSTVRDAINDGFADLEELAEEMGSWRDNMNGTPAENTGRFEVVTETADTLEGLDRPTVNDDLPESILDALVTYTYAKVQSGRQRTPSRSYRCSNACNQMSAGAEFIRGALDGVEDENVRVDLETLAAEVEEVISNVESLEFPGMYG